MRLNIYGQFVVSVVNPNGGTSKGRPVAFVEEPDKWSLVDVLIPNDLCGRKLQQYIADKFSAFAKPGKEIYELDADHPFRSSR